MVSYSGGDFVEQANQLFEIVKNKTKEKMIPALYETVFTDIQGIYKNQNNNIYNLIQKLLPSQAQFLFWKAPPGLSFFQRSWLHSSFQALLICLLYASEFLPG